MDGEGGSRLAQYSFLRPVGKGSYGEVNLAKLRSDGKKYVIKKLNLRNASSRERKAAEQEAQLLSRLKHPNIVAYRESWEGEEGLLYIVMDFCEGGDLYHKLKEQQGILLEEKQVVEWFVQITMALQYLHNEHIMHRDLKTQNIFLTRTDIIKVGDLGIARVLDNQYDMASTLIGTPYYMSPELFSNQPYNYKSDVWALGCCVYEMATLKHAFNAKDMNSLVFRIIEGKLPTMPKNYSPELGELIGTMLSKDPKHRPNARDILKRPYIKHHISVFLENIKKRPARNPKRTPQSKGDASSAKAAPQEKDLISRQSPAYSKSNKDQSRKKSPVRRKPVVDAVPEESIPEHCESSNNTSMSSASVSITTLSKVDIDMSSIEKAGPRGDHLIPSERRRSSLPQETRLHKKKPIGVRLKEDQFKANPKLDSKPENHDMAENEDTMKLLQPLSDHEKLCVQEQLDSTEKLLEPFVPISIPDGSEHKNTGEIEVKVSSALQPNCSDLEPSISQQRRHKLKEQQGQNSEKFDAALPRPLPFPPSAKRNINKKTRRNAEAHSSDVPEFSRDVVELQDRPLSARERRRLRKSQEEMLPSAPRFVGVTSHSSCGELKAEIENEDITKSQSSPDLAIHQNKDVAASHFSDDDLGSTSSTDKSETDPKEGKSDSSEMFDLVELMTQTLKIEPKDRCETPQAPVSEFRPRRKYRDTLILHGKAAEEPQEFPFNEFPSDTGSEKVRRMIEALRMDVVHGLGVKLLEKVYDIMNEDDESQREMHLQEHMGEKYASYSSKVRQLKFFEENAQF